MIKCVLVGHPIDNINPLMLKILELNQSQIPDSSEFDSGVMTHLSLDGQSEPTELQLQNSARHQDYDRLRSLSYQGTDVVLILFSLIQSSSLEQARSRWATEIKNKLPGVPVVLVGTDVDKRDFTDDFHISSAQGKEAAQAVGAVAYVECSAETGFYVKEVFETAVQAVNNPSEINSPFQVKQPSHSTPVLSLLWRRVTGKGKEKNRVGDESRKPTYSFK